MAQRQNMTTILRLMCLLSFCNSGISASDYDRLKHQFLQTYGFDKLMAFNTLKKTGLLTSREALVALKASVQGKDKPSSTSFLQVAKKLGLNVGQNQSVVASSQMQEDVSYVFNGANTLSFNPYKIRFTQAGQKCLYFKSEMVIYIIYQGVTTSHRICYLRRKCRNLNF